MGMLRIGLFAMLSPILAGCVTYTEHLRFNPDGSGSVSARLVVARDALGRASETPGFRPDFMVEQLSRERLEQKLNIEGVKVQQITIERSDTATVWEVAYAFADLESFRRVRNEGRDVSLREYGSGTYELNLVFSGGAGSPGEGQGEPARSVGESEGEQVTEISVSDSLMLTSLLEGFSATFTFELPTPVISAPRGRISGTTASFVWSYEREGIRVLEPKTMRVIFRKGDLDWPTFEALPGDETNSDAWESSY